MSYERPVDGEGRVLLPADVREALDLTTGDRVTIELDDDGVVRLEPTEDASYHDLQRRDHGSPSRAGASDPTPDRAGPSEE